MTLIERGADDWIGAETGPCLSRIGLRTGIAIATRRAVRIVRVRAEAGRRITSPDVVTLVESGTNDRVTPHAATVLTAVGLRAGVAIATHRAVQRIGIGTGSVR